MTKNITIGISDELSERMEKLKEVNWSAVARECIEQYIKQRMSKGLEPAISKLKELRGSEFRKGHEFVIQNIESIGLEALEEIAYPNQNEKEHLYYLWDLLHNCIHVPPLMPIVKCEFDRYDDHEVGQIKDLRYEVTNDFVNGMMEAAKELLEKSK